jgi:hypothetical protein
MNEGEYGMSDTTIKIINCNNIVRGEIIIYADKLNILFGRTVRVSQRLLVQSDLWLKINL